MSAPLHIGIDLGGTKIAGIALRGDDTHKNKTLPYPHPTETLCHFRMPTPRHDYPATLQAINSMVEKLTIVASNQLNLTLAGGDTYRPTIGLAIPGSVSPITGKIQNANSTWLNGQYLHKDLCEVLSAPVRMANDANCFALSEAYDGTALGARSVFGVILGTGVGGGLIYEGKIINGPRSIGGEWGHTSLPWPEQDEFNPPLCWCGLQGCIESWLSGPALLAEFNHHASTPLNRTEEIIEMARSQNAKNSAASKCAHSVLERHCQRLGRALAMVVNIFDPEIIVLGGGLSNLSHLYQRLPEAMAPYIFADDRSVAIAPPKYGDASGMRGAARLWQNTGPDE